jgi:arginine N-succinyltransferase
MTLRSEEEAFIGEVLPKFPVYVALLAPEAQQVIGKTHPHTIPAVKMLINEGFYFTHDIDPIDGGPFLAADLENIRTVKQSKLAVVHEISPQPLSEDQTYLMSNDRFAEFRACRSAMAMIDDKRAILGEDAAEALQVHLGDTIRYII